jgi:ribosomal protein S18 acetylase RimI-like enzyme
MPRRIYVNHPHWIPPLQSEMRRMLDARMNPFFEYGQVALFGVRDADGSLVGRIAAILNPEHEKVHGERVGFFGLIELVNDVEVARKLFASVHAYLREKDCTRVIGPVNFTTNDESGLLLEGFDRPPCFMCNYCPPYYHDLLRTCGLTKAIDTLTYEASVHHFFPLKYERVLARASANPAIVLSPFRKKQAQRDVAVIRDIYNRSFRETWGFVPMTSNEARDLADRCIAFADEYLVWIARYHGQPAGMILGLPDINRVLKKLDGRLFPFGIVTFLLQRRRIDHCRVIAFGVLPEYRSLGIETLLIEKVRRRMLEGGYRSGEFSVVMENNLRMRGVLEAFGFRLTKRFRLYQGEIPC